MINWIKNTDDEILKLKDNGKTPFFYYPLLEDTGLVKHAFSTKLGGVSKGYFESLNFAFTRGDEDSDVLENFSRMAEAMGVDKERFVMSRQTHTTNVVRVDDSDAGRGILRQRSFENIDGLVTNTPGLTLVTSYADCVPLYFLDTKNKAIGLSHSGWRGTVKRMGKVTLQKMAEEFGTNPEDVIACVGPSICKASYEISEEVAVEFKREFGDRADEILEDKHNGHYQLDLWEANRIVLTEAGILPEHLAVTNICTYCNPDIFYSHRRTGDKRGNMCAFLSLI